MRTTAINRIFKKLYGKPYERIGDKVSSAKFSTLAIFECYICGQKENSVMNESPDFGESYEVIRIIPPNDEQVSWCCKKCSDWMNNLIKARRERLLKPA